MKDYDGILVTHVGGTHMLYSIANKIDTPDLDAIKRLESKLGKTLIAFNVLESETDALDETELSQIKSLEEELGVVLVAVRH
jgi:hypothetical protein